MSSTETAGRNKLPLAAQIFIALLLAIVVGLLMQAHADFANEYNRCLATYKL